MKSFFFLLHFNDKFLFNFGIARRKRKENKKLWWKCSHFKMHRNYISIVCDDFYFLFFLFIFSLLALWINDYQVNERNIMKNAQRTTKRSIGRACGESRIAVGFALTFRNGPFNSNVFNSMPKSNQNNIFSESFGFSVIQIYSARFSLYNNNPNNSNEKVPHCISLTLIVIAIIEW